MKDTITVLIPHIPTRKLELIRAMRSVVSQSLYPDAIIIQPDNERFGAAENRSRGLYSVDTKWVAFLDDDDEFLPHHLEALLKHALENDADFVYSWFVVLGGTDPFPKHHFTDAFDPDNPIQTTITTLVRSDYAKQVGFYEPIDDKVDALGNRHGEDYEFLLNMMRVGAKVSHLVDRTWIWHHHLNNTSGKPDRW